MSRSIIALLLSAGGLAAVSATATSAQAQVYGEEADLYVGDHVQVFASGRWHAATVMDIAGDDVLVRYRSAPWAGDEWVDIERVSPSGTGYGVVYRPAIQVYFGERWYPGVLIATRGDRYQVRYRGVTEWVPRARWHHNGHKHRVAFERRHRHGYVDYRPPRRGHDWRDKRWDKRRDRDDGRRRGRDRD